MKLVTRTANQHKNMIQLSKQETSKQTKEYRREHHKQAQKIGHSLLKPS